MDAMIMLGVNTCYQRNDLFFAGKLFNEITKSFSQICIFFNAENNCVSKPVFFSLIIFMLVLTLPTLAWYNLFFVFFVFSVRTLF